MRIIRTVVNYSEEEYEKAVGGGGNEHGCGKVFERKRARCDLSMTAVPDVKLKVQRME